MANQTCTKCKTEFDCLPTSDCWCHKLPNIMAIEADLCLCPECLKKEINEKLRNSKMRYIIAGGGAYGTHYVRKIKKGIAIGDIDLDELIVVDKDPNCKAKNEMKGLENARQWTGTWNDFGKLVWESREMHQKDIWIPAPFAPHILSDWIVQRVEHELQCNCKPEQNITSLPEIPFAQTTEDGRILLSHAPARCPLDCIEPEVCAITEKKRWWEMRDTIEEMLSKKEGSASIDETALFFCKHHCDPGQNDVGGISFKTIFDETDKVLESLKAGKKSFGVATFSSCHGIINFFEIK